MINNIRLYIRTKLTKSDWTLEQDQQYQTVDVRQDQQDQTVDLRTRFTRPASTLVLALKHLMNLKNVRLNALNSTDDNETQTWSTQSKLKWDKEFSWTVHKEPGQAIMRNSCRRN